MSKRKRYSQAEKIKLLEECQSSGLSRTAFCALKEIPYSAFKNWSLRKEEDKKLKDNFYQVKLTPTSNQSHNEKMSLTLADGHRFEWSCNIDSSALKNLLSVLGLV